MLYFSFEHRQHDHLKDLTESKLQMFCNISLRLRPLPEESPEEWRPAPAGSCRIPSLDRTRRTSFRTTPILCWPVYLQPIKETVKGFS